MQYYACTWNMSGERTISCSIKYVLGTSFILKIVQHAIMIVLSIF